MDRHNICFVSSVYLEPATQAEVITNNWILGLLSPGTTQLPSPSHCLRDHTPWPDSSQVTGLLLRFFQVTAAFQPLTQRSERNIWTRSTMESTTKKCKLFPSQCNFLSAKKNVYKISKVKVNQVSFPFFAIFLLPWKTCSFASCGPMKWMQESLDGDCKKLWRNFSPTGDSHTSFHSLRQP